jgi:hypothetical protein
MPPRLHRITSVKMYFIPVTTRMPLKFGAETLTSTTCLRVATGVVDESNHYQEGWGETPLSVQWVWPSRVSYERRHQTLKRFCLELASAWMRFPVHGHPLEAGYDFQNHFLATLCADFNQREGSQSIDAAAGPDLPSFEPMPWLAALVCNSAFDIAMHDAFGRLASRPAYATYGPEFLERDLASFLEPARD